MQRHTAWPFALAFAIFMASGTKDLAAPDLGFDFSYDKLAHLLVFGLLATAVLRIPRIFNKGWLGICITIALTSLYDALTEYCQSFSAVRYVELDDWVADALGTTLACILYFKWHWYRRKLEWHCFGRRIPESDSSQV